MRVDETHFSSDTNSEDMFLAGGEVKVFNRAIEQVAFFLSKIDAKIIGSLSIVLSTL